MSSTQARSLNSVAASAVRNLATNSIGATGKGASSTGTAVSTSQETMIPLSSVARFGQGQTSLVVNHQGGLVANTISFNLRARRLAEHGGHDDRGDHEPGSGFRARSSARSRAPPRSFWNRSRSEPYLVLAAFATIYISLGMLYESFVHPLTILSTLPSAGVGAVLALMLFHTQFDIIAMIGVILLIGIVKKNAIMMIDFALDAERMRGLSPADAIFEACLLRFRPIMMTTMASLLGAVPLLDRDGRRQRVPPAARHHDRRRTGAEPDPDPLHHAGGLSVPRSFPALERTKVARPVVARAASRTTGYFVTSPRLRPQAGRGETSAPKSLRFCVVFQTSRPWNAGIPAMSAIAPIAAARTRVLAPGQKPFFAFEASGDESLRSQGRPAEFSCEAIIA